MFECEEWSLHQFCHKSLPVRRKQKMNQVLADAVVSVLRPVVCVGRTFPVSTPLLRKRVNINQLTSLMRAS